MAQPSRPSVDRQLSAAKAIHGSRLEQLIRDNQDFRLLHARESQDDKAGLPLWLRVYWRKNHPETTYSPDDPTGGYPRALKNLHTWMVENQDLPFGQPSDAAMPLPTSAPETTKASKKPVRTKAVKKLVRTKAPKKRGRKGGRA